MEEDLETIGCAGFLRQSWNIQSKVVLRELKEGVLNQYEKTLRGNPAVWTDAVWTEVYACPKGGAGYATR